MKAGGLLGAGVAIALASAGCAPREQRTETAHASTPATPSAALHRATEWIALRAGTFERGRAASDRLDESPLHTVQVGAFSIQATLVTRAEFARFTDETGYVTTAEKQGYGVASREGMDDWAWERVPRGSWRRPFIEEDPHTAAFLEEDAPVVMVSWVDANAFCEHAGGRLPTEAEWEYAMRAGSQGSRYPWGEEPLRDGRLALNYWQGASHHHNDREDGFVYVSPVRAYSPNAWGLYDPVGNVWQWTADWYAPDTYERLAGAGVAKDPAGATEGKHRVLRGGSWWCGACTCEGFGLFYRGKALPDAAFNNNGFRCVRPG